MATITDMPSDQTELLSNNMEVGDETQQDCCEVETALHENEEQKSTISNSSSTSVQECLKSGSLQKVYTQTVCDFEVNVEVHNCGDFIVTKKEKVDLAPNAKMNNLVTFHDIGLNHDSFDEFMAYNYNAHFYDKFVMYHVDCPGQEKDAPQFSDNYVFPTLPVLAVKLRSSVLEHFKLMDLIGLGVGAGANILMHLAMVASERFLGIAVTDPSGSPPGFKEWGEEKIAAWQLGSKGFTSTANKFLIWHLFGASGTKATKNDATKAAVNLDLMDRTLRKMNSDMNPHNLSEYVKSYMNRKDILAELKENLKCRVLIITSEFSPYKEQGEAIQKALSQRPKQSAKEENKSEIMIGQNAINIFFEDPGKCGEAVLALMQGCGIAPTLRSRSASKGGPMHRTASMCEEDA